MASIRTAGLTKDFGDLRAVNAIDLDLPESGVAGFVRLERCGSTKAPEDRSSDKPAPNKIAGERMTWTRSDTAACLMPNALLQNPSMTAHQLDAVVLCHTHTHAVIAGVQPRGQQDLVELHPLLWLHTLG